MRVFTLDENYSIVCEFKDTRNGFKHIASLVKNGSDIYETKICYLNRTWERFEYETILLEVISENFKGEEKQKYIDVIKKER